MRNTIVILILVFAYSGLTSVFSAASGITYEDIGLSGVGISTVSSFSGSLQLPLTCVEYTAMYCNVLVVNIIEGLTTFLAPSLSTMKFEFFKSNYKVLLLLNAGVKFKTTYTPAHKSINYKWPLEFSKSWDISKEVFSRA